MKELKECTERQAEVLRFLIRFHRDRGVMPSIRQVMAAFDFGSTNAVTGHLKPLAAKGYIEMPQSQLARSCRILFDPEGKPYETLESLRADVERLRGENDRLRWQLNGGRV
jgi:SOS-response transcriptional repressor LexA